MTIDTSPATEAATAPAPAGASAAATAIAGASAAVPHPTARIGDRPVELVVLDMAGTTVRDDGLVERAFALAAERAGFAPEGEERERALDYVRETMGQSKIAVFRVLTGDEELAQRANAEFEGAYAELVGELGVSAIDGALETVRLLRASGVAVALTTGFAPSTRDALLDALGWHDLADVALAPAEAGRGRPHPDLPLTALLRTGAGSVGSMVVVGDTQSDIGSGLAAGAGLVVGVLTGTHDRAELEAAGAHAVIDSVADLPALLGLDEA
ncbi:phosphonatase-like hydrolase [Agromyces sp. CFH 90414]|uniref:Phosphonatase-like hydrolase n=1 Tax=Agromyces agglutinans TaxID=2662258 RepID=A0A6I2FCP0_9MICO|nr:phosphonatase-like hydrolase [Agromyces agglutinans]MRG58888.1 phosphonatase-like hydrolase [Agromyces agglutinans]